MLRWFTTRVAGARPRPWAYGSLAVVAIFMLLSMLRCETNVRVATFNIRMFPSPTTELSSVAATIATIDADILGVQEITSADALAAVLSDASTRVGRDYRAVLSRCRHPRFKVTTGVVWDASQWRLVEARDYPQLRPDEGGACGLSQPGIAGVFERDGKRVAVLSVHMDAFPKGYRARREQWRRMLAIQRQLADEFDAEVLSLGDFNSTGFTTEPPEEPAFVREIVDAVGFELLSDDLDCTEYYRPSEASEYLPSILDHIVASGGQWDAAETLGLCQRLRCKTTAPDEMDRDFFEVSDHCPVFVDGAL